MPNIVLTEEEAADHEANLEMAEQEIERLLAAAAKLRAALLKFVDHFGPLEDNHMLHSEARACFNLAREALGPEQHDAAIKRAAGIAR